MDFIFGCWSHHRSSVDCRPVVEKLAAFFKQQAVPYRLFPLDPHFAVGVASFMTEKDRLVWVLVIIFTKIIGAALYYFLRYRKRNALPPAASAIALVG